MTLILTCQGKSLDIANPNADDIDPHDIAHALSHQCRFNGHSKSFYSVAQHACMVAELVLPEYRLAALLHHASSAYLGHLAEPLKRCLLFYRDLEQLHWTRICERFQLDPILPEVIQSADLIVTATEQRDLMPHVSDSWVGFAGVEPLNITIRPWNAQKARIVYLQNLLDQLEIRRAAPLMRQCLANEEDLTGARTRHQCHELTRGFSAAEMKRTPTLTTLDRADEPDDEIDEFNSHSAQSVEGIETSSCLDPDDFVPHRETVLPALFPTHLASWKESLTCDEPALVEMTAGLTLPETIHHEITKRDRRRVE